MKTTITEEFEDGQLVRRTTVTDGEPPTGGYVHLPASGPFTLGSCNCPSVWHSVTPPPPCPLHGQMAGAWTTVSANASTTTAEFAEQVGWAMRSAA